MEKNITSRFEERYTELEKTICYESPSGKSSLWIVEDYVNNYKKTYKKVQSLLLEHEPPIVVFGKQCRQPRNVGFFSDESKGYNYSGQLMASQKFSKGRVCKTLMTKINDDLGTKFNGVLVNEYINGSKTVGSHSDDESNLSDGVVACITFGQTRKFVIRHKESGDRLEFYPEAGSLLVMDGDFQKEYKHEIPAQRKITESRISLTMRCHLS